MHTKLATVIVFQAAFVLLWQLMSLFPWFATVMAPAGTVTAVSHIGWWLPLETISLLLGVAALSDVDLMRLYQGALVLAILGNVVHLGLAANEHYVACNRSICEPTYNGFLLAFCVALALMALLKAIQCYLAEQVVKAEKKKKKKKNKSDPLDTKKVERKFRV